MKKIALIIFCFIALSCSNNDEEHKNELDKSVFLGELEWVKSFGGSLDDTAQAIISTNDGGFAILGFSNSIDGDINDKALEDNDYWMLKLDQEGILQWSRTYGGSLDDIGKNIVQTSDGGYALIGYSQSSDGDASNNEGFHDNWILKLDASGNIEWERSFGFSGHDHSYDLIQTSDGGFFFSGFLDITAARSDGYLDKGSYLTRHGVGEFWGTKLDAQGNLEWRKYFGGTNNDRAHGVVQSNDGGFVLAGFSESEDYDISNSKGSYDFWVVKISSDGDLVWERSFGGTGIEIAYDIAKTMDNTYVITGNTFSNDTDVSKNNGESDIWLIKIDDNGSLLWEKNYGGPQFDAAQSVSLASDGGFIITGNSKSSDLDATSNLGENDIWLLKTNASGDLIWQKSYGGSGIDFGFDAIETADQGVILVGDSQSTEFMGLQLMGNSDAIVIKVR
ncbi:hypothetical protein H4O18_05780 [Arenibacter sp. BSSL-BM3]|uniref:Bulb-type lectin domain-containing protein n=1 Tax=Arenibacter arenosicollis TaxID=2762274 RepID=A0ABR7QJY2_9FLAO|nr:hypothetical protein [Arenibacter arenosicollis]MBC8767495.1 hypothetical protein [Arenibacter arenosicollis]